MEELVTVVLMSLLPWSVFAQKATATQAVHGETLLQADSSWDGVPYKAYPAGRPELTLRRITIAPHSTLHWHLHPMPNVGYVLSGEITVEKKDGTKKHYKAGETIAETVDSLHRGVTGDEAVVLLVFYAGTHGMPLSVQEQ